MTAVPQPGIRIGALRVYPLSCFVPPAHQQQRIAFLWDRKRPRYRTLPIGPIRRVR